MSKASKKSRPLGTEPAEPAPVETVKAELLSPFNAGRAEAADIKEEANKAIRAITADANKRIAEVVKRINAAHAAIVREHALKPGERFDFVTGVVTRVKS